MVWLCDQIVDKKHAIVSHRCLLRKTGITTLLTSPPSRLIPSPNSSFRSTHTHRHSHHVHLIEGILNRTRREEQMSLWTQIRIITLTALQTAMWPGAWKTNDRMLTRDDLNCNFCACASTCSRLLRRRRYFPKVTYKQVWRHPSCRWKHVLGTNCRKSELVKTRESERRWNKWSDTAQVTTAYVKQDKETITNMINLCVPLLNNLKLMQWYSSRLAALVYHLGAITRLHNHYGAFS